MSEPPSNSPRLYGAFAGCCLIWGSTFLAIRFGNRELAPLWGAAVRLAIACPILLVLARAGGHRLPRGPGLRAAAGFGALNFGVSLGLLYWGEQQVSSGVTAVIFAIIPLTTALLTHGFGLERLTAGKLAGATLGLLGVGVIFSGESFRGVPWSGLAAIVAAAVTASLSGVPLKRGPRGSPLGVNAVATAVGCPMLLAGSFAVGEPHRLPLTAGAIGPVLYLALAGSVVAFGLYVWLVGHWPLTRTSFVAVVVPVIAVGLAALSGDGHLAPASYLGALLVMAGIGVSIASESRRARRATRSA